MFCCCQRHRFQRHHSEILPQCSVAANVISSKGVIQKYSHDVLLLPTSSSPKASLRDAPTMSCCCQHHRFQRRHSEILPRCSVAANVISSKGVTQRRSHDVMLLPTLLGPTASFRTTPTLVCCCPHHLKQKEHRISTQAQRYVSFSSVDC